MPTPHPIILHHFDQSPFSEKIRVVFGFKKLAWNSVRVSRIMPRPDLMPMTGGYRRTPTMQIGADIYCDTQIIIRELEARFPTPTLFPMGHAGIPWALGMWSDRPFFQNTVNRAWEQRIRAVGHGSRSEMSSQEALEIAAQASPQTSTLADPDDPNGRRPGDHVSIAPDDYGKVQVHGEIVSLSAQHIAIRRHDERAGETVAHFPRAGFVLLPC